MHMTSSRKPAALLFVILGALAASGCAPKTDELSRLSAGFRKEHDLRSLTLILGHLSLGMPRAEVEQILGRPDYSPIEGLYYYAVSDRKTEEGTPIGLIVEYRRTDVRTGETVLSGKLESLYLGPIGE